MVKSKINKAIRKEENSMNGLMGFYLIGSIVLLGVALVYWADAIRGRAKKK